MVQITLQGLNKVRSKGRWYYYHRKTQTRIPDELLEPGRESELLKFVDRLIGKAKHATSSKTLGALIVAYKASPEFASLAARTRQDYGRVFDYLADIAGMELNEYLDEEFVIGARDKAFKTRTAGKDGKPRTRRRFANYLVQVMSLLFSWGKPRGWLKHMNGNPAADVPLIARPKNIPKANRAWRPHEREAIFTAAKKKLPQILVPLALGRWAGLREADAVYFQRRFYDGKNIDLDQGKTGNPLWLPAPLPLREILDAALADAREKNIVSPQLGLNSRGKPWTQNGYTRMFFKLIGDLKVKETIAPGITFHGLRHTVGKELADLGFDNETIAAYLGHTTIDMARHYSREADRNKRRKAVVRKLDRLHRKNNPVTELQNRVAKLGPVRDDGSAK
jgi:integrase